MRRFESSLPSHAEPRTRRARDGLSVTIAAVVLAAGHGTRFKSATPKVLHEVAGWPLVRHVYQTVREAGCMPIVVVTQPGVDLSTAVGTGARLVEQPADDHGTAAATAAAAKAVGAGASSVVVLFGDSPLLRPETVRAVAELREASGAAVVVAFARVADPGDFGHVDFDAGGEVRAIVEAAEAGSEGRDAAPINAGLMAFDGLWLWGALERVTPSPVNGERYLPATVALARADGRRVVGHEISDLDETIGCDDLTKLAAAEKAPCRRVCAGWHWRRACGWSIQPASSSTAGSRSAPARPCCPTRRSKAPAGSENTRVLARTRD